MLQLCIVTVTLVTNLVLFSDLQHISQIFDLRFLFLLQCVCRLQLSFNGWQGGFGCGCGCLLRKIVLQALKKL